MQVAMPPWWQPVSSGERERGRDAAGGVHEALEERRLLGAVREQLGVPLDPEAERGGRVPERLDGPVRGGGAGLEPGADARRGLVVEGVDGERGAARQRVQER